MQALLIDDHALFREALSLLVESRFEGWQLRCAGSLAEGRARLAEQAVPLVLLDLALPDAQGLQALETLRADDYEGRIVVLSADDRLETVQAAIEGGAAGFVPKRADLQTLAQAIEHTLGGGVYLPPSALVGARGNHDMPSLTPRQRDVLQLLVEGLPNKLIARRLALSESSVKTHLEGLYERLGVNTRTKAVVMAARAGPGFTRTV